MADKAESDVVLLLRKAWNKGAISNGIKFVEKLCKMVYELLRVSFQFITFFCQNSRKIYENSGRMGKNNFCRKRSYSG